MVLNVPLPPSVLLIVSCFMQTIGGNICNASPISDLNPVLMACGAKLNLASKGHNFLCINLELVCVCVCVCVYILHMC